MQHYKFSSSQSPKSRFNWILKCIFACKAAQHIESDSATPLQCTHHGHILIFHDWSVREAYLIQELAGEWQAWCAWQIITNHNPSVYQTTKLSPVLGSQEARLKINTSRLQKHIAKAFHFSNIVQLWISPSIYAGEFPSIKFQCTLKVKMDLEKHSLSLYSFNTQLFLCQSFLEWTNMVVPLQLFKDRATLVLQRPRGHAPSPSSCPAGATIWPWLGVWDAGNVSVWAFVLWDNARQICDRAAVILAGRGCWGRHTKPEWDHGSLSTGRLAAFDVWSARLADSWCISVPSPVPRYTGKTTHVRKNVLPGLSFLRNVAHLSVPQSIWTPLNLGNTAVISVSYVCLVCGLDIWDDWEHL